jgi:hypothetical protein
LELYPGNGGKFPIATGIRRAASALACASVTPGFGAIELHGGEERRLPVEEPESLRQHADNFTRLAVRHDGPPDGRAVAAESRLPPGVAQNHGGRSARRIVRLGEQAPQERLHAEDRQNALGDVDSIHLLRLGCAGHGE